MFAPRSDVTEVDAVPAVTRIVPLPIDQGALLDMRVDYDGHPAYQGFASNAPMGRRISAIAKLGRNVARLAVKHWAGYYMVPADLRPPRTLRDSCRFAIAHAGWLWRTIIPFRPAPMSANVQTLVHKLQSDGCTDVQVPDALMRRISAASAEALAELRRIRGDKPHGRNFMESRTQALRHKHAALFSAVETFLASGGIHDAIAHYLGREVRLVDVAPQINDTSDDFWRRAFPDLGIAPPRAVYLHKDAAGGGVKISLYLSSVGPHNGPFSYIVGSHRLSDTLITRWVERGNDYGLSATDPETRARFASLPRWLRRKATIGDDLLDNDPRIAPLLSAERAFTGPAGTAVIFDPRGLHRGGMVVEGERVVITCVVA
jgi:hypothetical protein